MRSFWPVVEAAQADYEALREAALAGLVVRPTSTPVFTASMSGALRPRWTPYGDSRQEALAAGYALLLGGERRDRRASEVDHGLLTAQGVEP